jgi:hypothetical protein
MSKTLAGASSASIRKAVQRDLRIPLDHVRGATDDDGFRGWALGIRSPGTAIPGIISAGTYLKGGDKQFVYITRGTHPVVIELNDDKWDNIVLGVIDAKSAAMRINSAVKSM